MNLIAARARIHWPGGTFDAQNSLKTALKTPFEPLQWPLSANQQLALTLAGGDDYELAFTAPPSRRTAVAQAASASKTPVSRIGRIDAHPGIRLLDTAGQMQILPDWQAFDHFKG